jgi:hypothetical protein
MQAHETSTATLDCPGRGSGLVKRLEATRAEMHAFRRLRSMLGAALVVLLLAGMLAAADWLWTLDAGVRAAGLIFLCGVGAAHLVGGLLWRRTFGRADAAAQVESAFPQLGQRVCTTLEYVEPTPATMPAAPGLVSALAADTDRRTGSLDFRGLIPWSALRALGVALAGIVATFGVLLAVKPELRTAALRLFLFPANYTQLDVQPGDRTVKVGSDLTIEATLTGRPVPAAELHYRSAAGEQWTKMALASNTDSPTLLGTLQTTLQDCRDDFEYCVVAGPVKSPIYKVSVLYPLALRQLEATIEPPAYTRRPTATVKEGSFKVIAGSRVSWRIQLDRAPQTARLLIHPAGVKDKPAPDASVSLQIMGATLTGELPALAKELEYEIAAEASDGTRLDVNRFRIDVTPDRKPTIRFLKPREQIEVTPSTEIHMRIVAEDDFGLSKTGIVYQVGNGKPKTLFLEEDPKQPTTLRAEAVLPLEDHEVNFQDGVTYFAFTEDNHPDQPQRATTELQFIDIRPYKRTFQLLDGGGS